MTAYTAIYADISAKLDGLRIELAEKVECALNERIRRTLVALTKVKEKPRYVAGLESRLEIELKTHRRPDRLGMLLDMLEDEDEVACYLKMIK